MAYTRRKYTFQKSTEYEFVFKGNYGAKGEKRAEKSKATPEQVRRQNRLNKQKKIRRLIKANFSEGDFWVTLTYPKGARPSVNQVMKDWDGFIRRMKTRYKKLGKELKWIRRIEIGSRGAVHAHVIINRLEGEQTDLMIKECWKPGHVNYATLYEEGDYEQLADYLAKDEMTKKQEAELEQKDRKRLRAYSHSRNLTTVEPQTRTYGHWTMRRIIRDGPKPTPGYYILKDSIRSGVNPYTGMSYLYYTENRLDEADHEDTTKNHKKRQRTELNSKELKADKNKTERRSTGMQVKIYLSSGIKSSRATDGVAGYVIAMPTDRGDATLTDFEYVPAMTHNQSAICTLNCALKRLKQPCDIEIFTDSPYLQGGLDKLDERIVSGWHKRDGEPVKFAEEWQRTATLLGAQPYSVFLKQQNEYTGWLTEAVTKLTEQLKAERTDRMETKELEELVRKLKKGVLA